MKIEDFLSSQEFVDVSSPNFWTQIFNFSDTIGTALISGLA